jgi:hypothetical protein
MSSSGRTNPPALLQAAAIAVLVFALQLVVVPLFAAPAANLAPRDLPIVIAGPPPAATALSAALSGAEPGAFTVTQVPDPAAADQALRDRKAYAGLIIETSGLSLHTAPGASPAVANLLAQATAALGAGRPVPVVVVVPGDPDDPLGAGFASGFLPLALTGMAAGVALAIVLRNRAAKLAGLVIFGVLAGLGAAAVLQLWIGVLSGSYLQNAGAIGLFAMATSATITGLGALLGRAGIALGVIAVFLVGNPLSAVASAPELLPQPWGSVGQYLPVGAGATLLRSTAFFDGAGAARPMSVLLGYAIIGMLLTVIGRATIGAAGERTGGQKSPVSGDNRAMV